MVFNQLCKTLAGDTYQKSGFWENVLSNRQKGLRSKYPAYSLAVGVSQQARAMQGTAGSPKGPIH